MLKEVDTTYFTDKGKRLFNYYKSLGVAREEEEKRQQEEKGRLFARRIGAGGVALGLLMIFGHFEHQDLSLWREGEITSIKPQLWYLSPICLNTDFPSSNQISVKLTATGEFHGDTELTLAAFKTDSRISNLHNITWKKDGFYVEITDPEDRRIGENGPRPEGQLSLFDKSSQDLKIYLGNKETVNLQKDEPLAALHIDSSTCS